MLLNDFIIFTLYKASLSSLFLIKLTVIILA